MNYLDLLCPDCLNKLEYHNSTFSQYQPSYWCKKCNEEKEFNYVRGFNLGYSTRQERSGLRVEFPEKKEEYGGTHADVQMAIGWNACIDEMKKINSSSAPQGLKPLSSSSASIKDIVELVKNDIVGKSALENWSVKGDDNFMQVGEIAHNRFYRLGEKLLKYLTVPNEGLSEEELAKKLFLEYQWNFTPTRVLNWILATKDVQDKWIKIAKSLLSSLENKL